VKKKNELGELAPVERMNNPPGLWVKQKRMWKEDTVDEDARAEMVAGHLGGWDGARHPYTIRASVAITIKRGQPWHQEGQVPVRATPAHSSWRDMQP
jgi:hypothetical protein